MMMTEKNVRSLCRRLQTYINEAKTEVASFEAIRPRTQYEETTKRHCLSLHAGLINSAEQALEFIGMILTGTTSERVGRLFDAFGIAASMFSKHGGCLLRYVDRDAKATPADVEWAKDRIAINELLKPLTNKSHLPKPTVKQVLAQGTFGASVTPQRDDRDERDMLREIETLWGLKPGSLMLSKDEATASSFTEHPSDDIVIDSDSISRSVYELVGDDERAARGVIEKIIDNIPGLNEALAGNGSRVIILGGPSAG